MWDFIVDNVLPLVGTLMVGAIGWFVANYIGKPLIKFSRLREEIHEALFFTANVSNREIDPHRYDNAVSELRRLAARLNALEHSLNRFVRRYFSWRGLDLITAIGSITGLSNSLHDKTGEKAGLRYDIEKALKFPMTYETRPKIREK